MQVQRSQRGLRLLCSLSSNYSPISFAFLHSWLCRRNFAAIVPSFHRRTIFTGMAMRRTRSRNKSKGLVTNLSSLFKPVQIQHNVLVNDVGSELTGKLEKPAILKILNKFTQKKEIKLLCQDNGLDSKGNSTL